MTALETKLLARDRSGILRSFALYGTATIDILLVYVVSVCMIPPISSPISLSQNLPLDQLSSHSIFAPVVSESRINICIYKKKKKKKIQGAVVLLPGCQISFVFFPLAFSHFVLGHTPHILSLSLSGSLSFSLSLYLFSLFLSLLLVLRA